MGLSASGSACGVAAAAIGSVVLSGCHGHSESASWFEKLYGFKEMSTPPNERQAGFQLIQEDAAIPVDGVFKIKPLDKHHESDHDPDTYQVGVWNSPSVKETKDKVEKANLRERFKKEKGLTFELIPDSSWHAKNEELELASADPEKNKGGRHFMKYALNSQTYKYATVQMPSMLHLLPLTPALDEEDPMTRGITQFSNSEALPAMIGVMCAHALLFLTYLFPWSDGKKGQDGEDLHQFNTIWDLQRKVSQVVAQYQAQTTQTTAGTNMVEDAALSRGDDDSGSTLEQGDTKEFVIKVKPKDDDSAPNNDALHDYKYTLTDRGEDADKNALDYFYVRHGSIEGVNVHAVYQFFRRQMKNPQDFTKESIRALRTEFVDSVRSGIFYDTKIALEYCEDCMKESNKDRPQLDQWVPYTGDCSVTLVSQGMFPFVMSFWPAETWKPLVEIILDAHYEHIMNVALLNRANHPEDPGAKYVVLNTFANFQVDEEVIFNSLRITLSRFADVDLHVLLAGLSNPMRDYDAKRGNKIDKGIQDTNSFCHIQKTLGTEMYPRPNADDPPNDGYDPHGVICEDGSQPADSDESSALEKDEF